MTVLEKALQINAETLARRRDFHQRPVLEGTMRSFKPEVFGFIEKRFREIVENISVAMGCQVEIAIQRVTYPVANDSPLAGWMAGVVREFDPDAEIDRDYRTMGAEDFSFMMQDLPGCFMLVGSADPEGGKSYGHHHPKSDLDEACLPYAVAILTQGAVEVLEQGVGG